MPRPGDVSGICTIPCKLTPTVQRCSNACRERPFGKLFGEEPANAPQDLCVHRGRHAPGLGVLLARVIDAEELRAVARQLRFRAMRKSIRRPRNNQSTLLQNFQVCIPGDFSERQHRARLQNLHLTHQIIPAIRNFRWERFVRRRRATNRCRDISILQTQAIIAPRRSWLIRKARFVQGRIEKIPRAVSRENTPRAIRSMRGRRKALD